MERYTYKPLTEKTFKILINTGLVASMLFLGACDTASEEATPTPEPIMPVPFIPERTWCGNGEGYVTHDESGWVFHDERIIHGELETITGIDSYAEAISLCTSEALRGK